MSDNRSELAKRARELRKTAASDHAANLIKALLNAVPVIGGTIASLIDDYIPESRQKRFEEFTLGLAEEMERLGDALNADYVKTDEFAYLFTRVYQNVARDYQREKLDAYRNILVNALRVDVDASIQERYLFLVEQLTPLHLRVLSAFVRDERQTRILQERSQVMLGSLQQTFQVLLPELPPAHLKSCLFDLDQMGITASISNSWTTMMTGHGASQIDGHLTPFGRDFLAFIRQA